MKCLSVWCSRKGGWRRGGGYDYQDPPPVRSVSAVMTACMTADEQKKTIELYNDLGMHCNADGAPSVSPFASGALLMVSAFVSLVVASV
jgi:hypothetical protein